jgi:hypothetical protein
LLVACDEHYVLKEDEKGIIGVKEKNYNFKRENEGN